jgi:TonB family protein
MSVSDAPPMHADVRSYSEHEGESKRGVLVPALIALLVVGGAIWGGTRLLRGSSAPQPTVASEHAAVADQAAGGASGAEPRAADEPTTPGQSAAARKGATAEQAAPTPRGQITSSDGANGDGSSAVHEEIPKVSASTRNTIHGHVRVSVRVSVDSSGRVVRESLDNPSSSNYFNRVASEAARKWRFASADQGSRQWVLRFEFGRDGTTVRAVGPRS